MYITAGGRVQTVFFFSQIIQKKPCTILACHTLQRKYVGSHWDPMQNPTWDPENIPPENTWRKVAWILHFPSGIQHFDGILSRIIPHIMWNMFRDIFPLSAEYPGKIPEIPGLYGIPKNPMWDPEIIPPKNTGRKNGGIIAFWWDFIPDYLAYNAGYVPGYCST